MLMSLLRLQISHLKDIDFCSFLAHERIYFVCKCLTLYHVKKFIIALYMWLVETILVYHYR